MLRTHCTENRDLRSQPRCFRCIIENFEVSNSGPEWPKLELRFFFTGPDLYQKSVIHYILLEKRHLTCEKHETNVVKLSSLKNGSMKTELWLDRFNAWKLNVKKNEWNKVCNYTHIYIYIRFNICKMYQACWLASQEILVEIFGLNDPGNYEWHRCEQNVESLKKSVWTKECSAHFYIIKFHSCIKKTVACCSLWAQFCPAGEGVFLCVLLVEVIRW